jgi:hypothetical protein
MSFGSQNNRGTRAQDHDARLLESAATRPLIKEANEEDYNGGPQPSLPRRLLARLRRLYRTSPS